MSIAPGHLSFEGAQSRSVLALQPLGQQPSWAAPPQGRGVRVQVAVQVPPLARVAISSQVVTQLLGFGQVDSGSQVSPASTRPLPQTAGQSLSRVLAVPLQLAGQQPSLSMQAVIGVKVQAAVQVIAVPVSMSAVQALPSLLVVGQEVGGSQFSPVSSRPLPHTLWQSLSRLPGPVLQPAGQQPSPSMQLTMRAWTQAALHWAALPVSISVVQTS